MNLRILVTFILLLVSCGSPRIKNEPKHYCDTCSYKNKYISNLFDNYNNYEFIRDSSQLFLYEYEYLFIGSIYRFYLKYVDTNIYQNNIIIIDNKNKDINIIDSIVINDEPKMCQTNDYVYLLFLKDGHESIHSKVDIDNYKYGIIVLSKDNTNKYHCFTFDKERIIKVLQKGKDLIIATRQVKPKDIHFNEGMNSLFPKLELGTWETTGNVNIYKFNTRSPDTLQKNIIEK
jgi:hypothetical protein